MRSSPLLFALLGLVAGLLFGIGLLVSGMSNPAKVLNFLDVLGQWDASLAFVMGGAVMVTVVGYPLVLKRQRPVVFERFALPTSISLDKRLVAGAVMFGVGWGIGGYCPGPAWTSVAALHPSSLVFIVCMLAGMWIGTGVKKRLN